MTPERLEEIRRRLANGSRSRSDTIALIAEVDRLLAENEQMKTRLEVLDGSWCRSNQAAGRGPCGACSLCNAQLRNENERLIFQIKKLESESNAARAENERLKGLLREARLVLTLGGSSCWACGAEPGCNIDCAICRWSSEAEAALSEREVCNA